VNGKPDSKGFAGGLDFCLADLFSARVIANGFDDTWLPKNILERVKETAAMNAEAL